MSELDSKWHLVSLNVSESKSDAWGYLTNANDMFWRQPQNSIIQSNRPIFFFSVVTWINCLAVIFKSRKHQRLFQKVVMLHFFLYFMSIFLISLHNLITDRIVCRDGSNDEISNIYWSSDYSNGTWDRNVSSLARALLPHTYIHSMDIFVSY